MEREDRIPRWRMLMWAMGQFGISLISYLVGSLLTYFYLPPETGQAAFPVFIERKAVFAGMTVLGLATFVTGIIGLFWGPLVATMSDRSRARMGRRRFYMLIGALPWAFFSVLVFLPPVQGTSSLNSWWLFGSMVLSALLSPFFGLAWGALQPEIGVTSRDRTLMATMQSITWAVGFALGNAIFPIKDALQSVGMTPLAAFRSVVIGLIAVGALAMLLPPLFIDERRWCKGHVSRDKPLENIAKAFKNRDWLMFQGASIVYGLGDRMLQLGMVYFITILLGLGESWVFTLGIAIFGVSFLWYPLVNIFAPKVGKKRLLIAGFVLQGISFALITVAGATSCLSGWPLTIVIVLIQSVIGAITGILPSSINADILRADAIRSGEHKEATFAGASGLLAWLPGNLLGLLFPSLLLLGRSVENPAGVRLISGIAIGFMALALVFMVLYNERRTMETLREGGSEEAVASMEGTTRGA